MASDIAEGVRAGRLGDRLIVAHRGASALAPENTFAAFDLAMELGADALETDLQITSDGVVVCIHDATLDRTTGGHGPVRAHGWDEVALLDAGAWKGPGFSGQRVPRLEAFLERYRGRVGLHLEVKAAEAVGRVVELLGADERGVEVSSFDRSVLRRLRDALPDVPCCLLLDRWMDPDAALQVNALGLPAAQLTANRVCLAHACGYRVRAWAIASLDEVARLCAIGVDELTLDDPAWGR